MSKELVISTAPHETRVAILEEGQLCEIYIEREKEFALVGSIYKGRVTRVLPGMQSAFVDIGLDGDAFLYVSDVFENLEEYDHVSPIEQKTERPEDQPGTAPAPVAFRGGGEEAPAGGEVPPEAAMGEEGASAHEALPGEVLGGGERESGEPQPPRIPQSGMAPPRPVPSSSGFDRGERQGQGFHRGDRGGDRGRPGRDRWGRGGGRGGGRRGGGGRFGRGRDLPPSKYASPRAGEPRGPRGDSFDRTPPPEDEQILLPGESLAKYRGRTPSIPETSPTEPPVHERSPEAAPEAGPLAGSEANRPAAEAPGPGKRGEHRFSLPVGRHGRLPSWVLADASSGEAGQAAEPEGTEAPSEEHGLGREAEASATEERREGETQASFEAEAAAPRPDASGPRAEEDPETSGPGHRADPDLSEEEVNSLAEQLAQAKHEETHEDAEADSFSGGADFEEGEAAGENGETEAETEHAETPEETEELEEIQAEAEPEIEAERGAGTEEEPHSEMIEAAGPEGSGPAAAAGPEDSLLPGETRSPHDPERLGEYEPRSARIEERPRARFQSRPAGRRGPAPGRGGGRFRGGRRQHGFRPAGPERRSYGPPRRPQLISEMLKAGQEVIVQIAKEPLGKKGARITSHVALPGRYLVYMPTIDHIGVSRKIAAVENRARLRRLVGEARGSYPGGFIVRTAAGTASDEEIRTDIEFLGRTWNQIKTQSEQRKAPALLHRDLNLVERILRDYVSEEYTAVWIDNEEEYSKVLEFFGRFQPKLVNRVKLFTKDTPIFEEFGIQHELDKALRPKVWLKSGGYIVINHTEALVAIDVNTGKFVGKGSVRLEDTIVKTNIEAVKEIVRQIRLRDLGGIIVVDFIDMEERRNREKVMGALQQALETDKAPSKVLSFNEFGLVAITRKRTKQALERVLCQPCPYCSGSGMVKSIPTICYEVQTEARKMAVDHDAPNLTLRVHPEIAKALKTRESMLIDELEQTTRKHVIIQSDATLHWEQYDIY